MKKVISIHLGSKMFQIEEDAYAYLNNVLNAQWKKQELEAQVADRLEQKLGSKPIVTYPDVVDALYQLGFSASEYQAVTSAIGGKRLYRQPKEKMIAGVCTGLGDYLEIDPVIMRILFVIAGFLGSLGLWLYIILWIIIPKAPKMLTA
ncbi:MAG: PspC domain-containing protein [Bacteroidales bacterium]|jgi:phage shock protein PspC (stress-responsive transcriptional regulator)|nr:PspC domain-containing protein [Bacteroidales bacterium]